LISFVILKFYLCFFFMPLISPQEFIKIVRKNLRTAVSTPIIGLDLGLKFVGLSISDSKASQAYVNFIEIKWLWFSKVLGRYITTQPSVLVDEKFTNYIQKQVLKNEAKGIVVGYPKGDNVIDFSIIINC